MGVVGIAAPCPREPHHLLVRVVRQLAVARERGDIEVRGAMREVGVSRLQQLTDELDDQVDRLGRARLRVGGAHLERVHVAVEARHLGFRQLEVRHAELTRLGQDRVVDVGDVAYVLDLVPELFEPADQ